MNAMLDGSVRALSPAELLATRGGGIPIIIVVVRPGVREAVNYVVRWAVKGAGAGAVTGWVERTFMR